MKNIDNLPKILIIAGYTFEGTDATSITLKNIFSSWSPERIAFVHITHLEKKHELKKNIFTICDRKFGNILIRKNKIFFNEILSSRSAVGGTLGVINSTDIKSKIFNIIHTFISAYRTLIPVKYSYELDKFIKEYKPDIIYTPLGSINIMYLAYKVSIKYNILIYPHFMDDWIATKYARNIFLIIPRFVQNYYLKKIFERTGKAFTICEKMAHEYSNKYNKSFLPLMNCVDDSLPSKESDMDENTVRYCYSGGFHLNRWKSLEFLCGCLERFESDKSIELNIYSKESDWQMYKDKFVKYSFVHFMGFISQTEMLDQLKKQTILIHIESFDKEVIEYTRLSISTKIPEYLSMKKAILAIGPSDIASIEYLKINQCAFIVDRKEEDLLQNEIEKIMDLDLREEVAVNAYFLFKKNHTKEAQQQLLRNYF